MNQNFITTLNESEKIKTIDELCKFVELIHKIQDYIYWWNKTNTSESDFLEIENILEDFSNNIKMFVVWIIVNDEKIAYLKNMRIDSIMKWIEFYRHPKFLRNFSENINKLLWYNG